MPVGHIDPVGTIRIRWRNHRTCRARMIKTRMDGPVGKRWVLYARWWWEHNRGPVPRGKRVIHRNGDTLDDRPENLAIGDASDVLAVFHGRDPVMSERAYEAAARGIRRHNTERMLARRLLGQLQLSLYYAVDHGSREIRGPYSRRRTHVYQALGLNPPPGSDCTPRLWMPLQLGWSGLSPQAALMLGVLLDTPQGLRTDELALAAAALSERLGYTGKPAPCRTREEAARLQRLGWVESVRVDSCWRVRRITPAAIAARGPHDLANVGVMPGAMAQRYQGEGYAIRPILAPTTRGA